MYTKSRKLLSTLLALALALSLFAAMPMTASASLVSTLSPAQRLAMLINLFDHGGDAGSTLSASSSGNTVTVSGTVTGAKNTLELTIGAGVAVIWKANYSGNINDMRPMIKLSGSGTFEVAGGSISSNSPWATILFPNSSTVAMKVSDGTVSNSLGVVITTATSDNINITVSGGTVSATYGDRSAIAVRGHVVVSGGTVSSKGGSAIYIANAYSEWEAPGTATISGGIIITETGRAIYCMDTSSAINISGNCFIFSYGTNMIGNDNDVFTGTANISGNAVLCAWDKPTSGTLTYYENSSNDLIVNSGATVKWGKQGTQTGIFYNKGGNEGFFPIDGIALIMAPVFAATVNNGSGGGNYAAGAIVSITADDPAAGKVFDKWTSANGVFFADESSASTSFTMPSNPVTVTATYKDAITTTPPPSTGGSMDNFQTKVNTYTQGMFTDVNENAWYGFNDQKVIATAYEHGLMTGNSTTTFNPTGNMTVAEAITIATRVHCYYMTGQKLEFTPTSPWYQGNVNYAINEGIITATDFTNYTRAVTRAEMAYIFSRCLPAVEFPAQNTVNSLPDVNNSTPYKDEIFMLYKAGVVQGSGTPGTFYPNNNIIRAEAAAIISRVILPLTRLSGRTYNG